MSGDHPGEAPGAATPSRQSAELSLELPEPILFNSFKHHAREIRRRIRILVCDGEPGRRALRELLRIVGARMTDLYVGEMLPETIAAELVRHLDEQGRLASEAYRPWIERQSGYAVTTLADGSRWCLRWGTVAKRHVHIHPGRYSPLTLRVRASLLKTVIATIALAEYEQRDPMSLNVVNDARRDFLQMGPVQAIPAGEGLGVVLRAMLDTPAP